MSIHSRSILKSYLILIIKYVFKYVFQKYLKYVFEYYYSNTLQDRLSRIYNKFYIFYFILFNILIFREKILVVGCEIQIFKFHINIVGIIIIL